MLIIGRPTWVDQAAQTRLVGETRHHVDVQVEDFLAGCLAS